MSTDVFSRYRSLDPVASAKDLPASAWSGAVLLDAIDERSATMQTQPRVSTTPPPPRRRWGLAAAVAAFIVVLAVGVVAVTQLGGNESEPVDTITTTTTIPTTTVPAFDQEAAAATAVAVAESYHAAFAAADVETATALLLGDLESDRHMLEFNAAFTRAGYEVGFSDCEAVVVSQDRVRAECATTTEDPVFAALGLAELVSPINVFPDGSVTWVPYSGGDIGLVGRAYSQYLNEFHPDEYRDVCDPLEYRPSSIVNNNGLALTGACGELAALHADEVGAWIAAGDFNPGATFVGPGS